MRIVFSRKGFDSSAGGCPSPIINGQPLSLPIPARKSPSPVRYIDLMGNYGSLVEDLTKGRVSQYSRCHLDPDLVSSVLPRRSGWRGALGQVGAAQAHLSNSGVGVGDLFLFWGLFRNAERRDAWTFHGPPEHRLFGWLQVGEILQLGEDGSFVAQKWPWLRDHPHVRNGWGRRNVLYIASARLHLGRSIPKLPGWGIFRRGLKLTVEGDNPSTWSVPDWLNAARGGVGMTYHKAHRWTSNGTMACARRGQEFVAEIGKREDAFSWLGRLFADTR
ncbi:hypothetical protein [Microbaculum sp. FT89]|uniref:Nmad3 family putative nucleotide modification protein n=1 Tax=Microbaculum sp. FT89 TaxID=3447298 RepID=UPI003F53BBB8